MNKYYLLTFNEDYGDEHNIPALACMNEEEYQKWLKTPSGELNPDYETELQNYNNYKKGKQEIDVKCKEILGNNWRSVPFNTWPKELLEEYNNVPSKFGYSKSYIQPPKRLSSSNMNAFLGNSGECFEESYMECYLMEDFIKSNFVKVTEITEEFYNIFNKAKLSDLSLCNVFEIND